MEPILFPNNQAKYGHAGKSASQEWKKVMSSRAAVNSRSVFLQEESHAEREIKKYMYLSALNMHIFTSKAKKLLAQLVICQDTLIFKT